MLDLQFYLNITLTNNCITWITPWIEKPTTSFLLCIYIFLFTAQGSGLSQLWPIQAEQPCHCPAAGQDGQSPQEWPPWFLGPVYFHPFNWQHRQRPGRTVLGTQASWPWHPPVPHRPGLPLGPNWPPLMSEACTVTSATAALPRSRAADSTSAPQASRPAAPSSGWPRTAKH